MNVRRRLFLSNFLMLILPVVLVILSSIGVTLVYTGVSGESNINSPRSSMFYSHILDVEKLAHELADASLAEKKSGIDAFNQRLEGKGATLALYAGDEVIYPAAMPADPLYDLISHAGTYTVITDRGSVYRADAGDYAFVLLDAYNSSKQMQRVVLGAGMLIGLILLVIITNWALTRFVFKSIMNPIDTLVRGVHQIRDGNLAYRIQYDKQDEFAIVCSEFNEMAQRLLAMVQERKKDEQNRRELIAGISHDLRTPLTSIKAYLEGLEKGVASTPEMRNKYLDIIKGKTESLERIIRQLFLFSKLDVGEFPLHLEPVNLGSELRAMLDVFAAEYDNRGLVIRIEDQLPNAKALVDIVQFRNVIQNILDNSLHYKKREQVEVTAACSANEQEVELEFADDGPGVADDELEKLFDVFYRTDASRKTSDQGSGLGLAISSRIIKRLGGSMRAEHSSAGGLAIIITLPRYTDKGGTPHQHEEHSDHRG